MTDDFEILQKRMRQNPEDKSFIISYINCLRRNGLTPPLNFNSLTIFCCDDIKLIINTIEVYLQLKLVDKDKYSRLMMSANVLECVGFSE